MWVTGTTVIRGRAQLAEFFAGAMEGLLPRLLIENLIAMDDRVACQLTETLVAAGEERAFSLAGFYTLRDGRIATAKIYREGNAEVV